MKEISDKQIIDFYQREGENHKHYQNSVYSKPHSRERFNTVCELIKPFAQRGETLLEIGCAEGLYCAYFSDQGGSKIVGIDISQPKIARAEQRPNIEYKVANWENLVNEFSPKQFDVILATEVIEHARDPQKLVDDCMKIGKYLVSTVPTNEQPLEDPMKIQGHLSCFRMDTYLKLFEKYKIKKRVQTKLYGYAIITS